MREKYLWLNSFRLPPILNLPFGEQREQTILVRIKDISQLCEKKVNCPDLLQNLFFIYLLFYSTQKGRISGFALELDLSRNSKGQVLSPMNRIY